MARKNKLLDSPPFPVDRAVSQLGGHLRVARVRRNMTIADVAERIGTGPRAVMDAEKGKPSTSIAVFAALLWLYDQLAPFEKLCDPSTDLEGLSLESAKRRVRASKVRALDNDF